MPECPECGKPTLVATNVDDPALSKVTLDPVPSPAGPWAAYSDGGNWKARPGTALAHETQHDQHSCTAWTPHKAAEQRDTWRKALSAHAADQRRRRGRYTA